MRFQLNLQKPTFVRLRVSGSRDDDTHPRCLILPRVDTADVAKQLPYGTVTVTAVKGGLEIPAEQGSDAIIIANAGVIVSLDNSAPTA